MVRTVDIPLPKLGVDLLSDETSIPEGAVRRAANVDIRRDGSFLTRTGYAIRSSGNGFHSLHADGRGVLVGMGTALYALDVDSYTLSLLVDTGSPTLMDFTLYNGNLYVTNHGGCWTIPAGAGVRRVGISLPNPLPTLEAFSEGGLVAGSYVVAISRVSATGEESPTKILGRIELPVGGGIRLTGMSGEAGVRYRAYLTPPDGDALYLSEEFASEFTTFVLTRMPDGAVRTSQHLKPLPGGDFIRGHSGRIFVANDGVLSFSRPLRPHLYDPRHDFIMFAAPIKFIEPVADGLYVGDARGVWFLPGNDPESTQMRFVSAPLALKRSSIAVSGAHFNPEIAAGEAVVAVWLSAEGYMLGRSGGAVIPLQSDRIRVSEDLEGRTRFVTQRGIKQLITMVSSTPVAAYGLSTDTTPLTEEP